MTNLKKLEKQLGIEFNDKNLLTQAFCHRSYLNENPGFNNGHNERLEFLGDAVLELVVTEHLFETYPDKEEGILTTWRASLVNGVTLSDIARELGFDDYLLLSKGESKETGKARQDILEDTLESFIGALHLDQGYDKVTSFISANIIPRLKEIIETGSFIDPKSKFQELAQEKVKITPHYNVIKEWGPDHDKHFVCGLYLDERLVAEGEGLSKQEAETNAAENALKLKEFKDVSN
jgi:ribonuclease III